MMVKITEDRKKLERIWNEEYASNAGKVIEVEELWPNGIVVANGWNFTKDLYEEVV